MKTPAILVLDSGIGGLTVYDELRRKLPDARYLYIADNHAFPYGSLAGEQLVARLLDLFEKLIEQERPDICVIACNTASTIALASLRARFATPFVGTVPAIKTAANESRSGLFSVLATPGTVQNRYTRKLIDEFATDCEVTLVGAGNLAELAERLVRGEELSGKSIYREIAPAFVKKTDRQGQGRRTDVIVLGCTHFPLLLEEMKKVAPWPVAYLDPSPAIARQVRTVLLSRQMEETGRDKGTCWTQNRFVHTAEQRPGGNITSFLERLKFGRIYHDKIVGQVINS